MKIKVFVKTNSKKQKIQKTGEDTYNIYLKSLPIENKANIELIKLLKKQFKKEVKIISGKTNNKKIIEVL